MWSPRFRASMLSKTQAQDRPLISASQLDMVHYLVNMGASVNQRDNKGMTPLHRAAFLAHVNGYLEIYEYFLS